jgi:hypothetical protein
MHRKSSRNRWAVVFERQISIIPATTRRGHAVSQRASGVGVSGPFLHVMRSADPSAGNLRSCRAQRYRARITSV